MHPAVAWQMQTSVRASLDWSGSGSPGCSWSKHLCGPCAGPEMSEHYSEENAHAVDGCTAHLRSQQSWALVNMTCEVGQRIERVWLRWSRK